MITNRGADREDRFRGFQVRFRVLETLGDHSQNLKPLFDFLILGSEIDRRELPIHKQTLMKTPKLIFPVSSSIYFHLADNSEHVGCSIRAEAATKLNSEVLEKMIFNSPF